MIWIKGCTGTIQLHCPRWSSDSCTIHCWWERFPTTRWTFANATTNSTSDPTSSRIFGQFATNNRATTTTIKFIYLSLCNLTTSHKFKLFFFIIFKFFVCEKSGCLSVSSILFMKFEFIFLIIIVFRFIINNFWKYDRPTSISISWFYNMYFVYETHNQIVM